MKNTTQVIAIANQKGGVGKTTTTFNLGAALALVQNKKVLLIDLDPQANLSEYLGYSEDGKPTMTDLIIEVATKSIISSDTVKSCIRFNENNKLYYIPSDINLANADVYMSNALSRETILKRILSDNVINNYDFVLIDCLPSLGVLLINAMSAAHKILIPVQTQKFSMDGLQTLTELLEQVRSTINSQLDLMGIIPTMVDNTNVSKNALETLAIRYKDKVLNSVIHKSVEAAKSSESGNALCRTKNKLGGEYKNLSEEILNLTSKMPDTQIDIFES